MAGAAACIGWMSTGIRGIKPAFSSVSWNSTVSTRTVSGFRRTSADVATRTDPDAVPRDKYLFEEIKERLRRWPAHFLLMMTIGEADDALDDPTKPWPETRTRIVMGTLTLISVAEDQEADGERISFNPCRLQHGIEVSSDPILEARRNAYEVSRQMRGGCPFNF